MEIKLSRILELKRIFRVNFYTCSKNKYSMYYCPLNFNFDLLKDSTILDKLPKLKHFKIPTNELSGIVSDKILDLFKVLKLDISLLEIFYRPPSEEGNIHVDSLGGDYTKLNWIFGGKNSTMQWWAPKNKSLGTIGSTVIDTKFLSYSADEVDLLFKTKLVGPNIIQVGIPHNVSNPDYEERYCFSLVYRCNGVRPTMAETLELFKKYI